MGEHETVAALAAQLAETRSKQGELEAALTGLRTSLATFDARLDTETGPLLVAQAKLKTLGERLDELAAQVKTLTSQLEASRTGEDDDEEPTVLRWDRGTPDELNDQLEEMLGWVRNTLRRQYPGPLKVLRKCWPSHMEVLWELSTLRAEYERVFGSDDIKLSDAQWWHERWFPGAMHRIDAALRPCQTGRCVNHPDKKPTSPPRGPAPRRPGPAGLAGLAFPEHDR